AGQACYTETLGYPVGDEHYRLPGPVQRWRRRNDTVDVPYPPFLDEGHCRLDDVVELPVAIFQLIHQFAKRRARCLELHVLADISDRATRNDVPVQHESLDPWAVDVLRMDFDNRHGPTFFNSSAWSWR